MQFGDVLYRFEKFKNTTDHQSHPLTLDELSQMTSRNLTFAILTFMTNQGHHQIGYVTQTPKTFFFFNFEHFFMFSHISGGSFFDVFLVSFLMIQRHSHQTNSIFRTYTKNPLRGYINYIGFRSQNSRYMTKNIMIFLIISRC